MSYKGFREKTTKLLTHGHKNLNEPEYFFLNEIVTTAKYSLADFDHDQLNHLGDYLRQEYNKLIHGYVGIFVNDITDNKNIKLLVDMFDYGGVLDPNEIEGLALVEGGYHVTEKDKLSEYVFSYLWDLNPTDIFESPLVDYEITLIWRNDDNNRFDIKITEKTDEEKKKQKNDLILFFALQAVGQVAMYLDDLNSKTADKHVALSKYIYFATQSIFRSITLSDELEKNTSSNSVPTKNVARTLGSKGGQKTHEKSNQVKKEFEVIGRDILKKQRFLKRTELLRAVMPKILKYAESIKAPIYPHRMYQNIDKWEKELKIFE